MYFRERLMLCLSRNPNEIVVIVCPDGSRILITPLEVRGPQVRLGIEAPPEYRINRLEIQRRIDDGIPRVSA
jgi:carbon storage regulator CsrA